MEILLQYRIPEAIFYLLRALLWDYNPNIYSSII